MSARAGHSTTWPRRSRFSHPGGDGPHHRAAHHATPRVADRRSRCLACRPRCSTASTRSSRRVPSSARTDPVAVSRRARPTRCFAVAGSAESTPEPTEPAAQPSTRRMLALAGSAFGVLAAEPLLRAGRYRRRRPSRVDWPLAALGVGASAHDARRLRGHVRRIRHDRARRPLVRRGRRARRRQRRACRATWIALVLLGLASSSS